MEIDRPARLQSLLQQFDQRDRCLGSPFLWDVLDQCLHRALHQHSQDRVWVHAYRAGHADRLGEDMQGIGSLGGYALYPAHQSLDGWKRTVWHVRQDALTHCTMARRGANYVLAPFSPVV